MSVALGESGALNIPNRSPVRDSVGRLLGKLKKELFCCGGAPVAGVGSDLKNEVCGTEKKLLVAGLLGVLGPENIDMNPENGAGSGVF